MLVAVISDVHVPYHDLHAWDLALQLLKAASPERVVVLGDFLDCEAVSDFVKKPVRMLGFQKEVEAGERALGELRGAVVDARVQFLEGNHERRLQRQKWTKAQMFASLEALTIPELLEFEAHEVEIVRAEKGLKIGKLHFLHGDEQKVSYIYPAANLYRKLGGNLMVGHFHRFDKWIHKQLSGSRRGVWVNGCLCGLNPEYAINPQWEQGVTFVDVAASGYFKVYQITFDEVGPGKRAIHATWEGEKYISNPKTSRAYKLNITEKDFV